MTISSAVGDVIGTGSGVLTAFAKTSCFVNLAAGGGKAPTGVMSSLCSTTAVSGLVSAIQSGDNSRIALASVKTGMEVLTTAADFVGPPWNWVAGKR
jgi:hypothetical protein